MRGWEEALGRPRALQLTDFTFSGQQMETRYSAAVAAVYVNYEEKLVQESDLNVDSLDPTQLLASTLVAEWARERVTWLQTE